MSAASPMAEACVSKTSPVGGVVRDLPRAPCAAAPGCRRLGRVAVKFIKAGTDATNRERRHVPILTISESFAAKQQTADRSDHAHERQDWLLLTAASPPTACIGGQWAASSRFPSNRSHAYAAHVHGAQQSNGRRPPRSRRPCLRSC